MSAQTLVGAVDSARDVGAVTLVLAAQEVDVLLGGAGEVPDESNIRDGREGTAKSAGCLDDSGVRERRERVRARGRPPNRMSYFGGREQQMVVGSYQIFAQRFAHVGERPHIPRDERNGVGRRRNLGPYAIEGEHRVGLEARRRFGDLGSRNIGHIARLHEGEDLMPQPFERLADAGEAPTVVRVRDQEKAQGPPPWPAARHRLRTSAARERSEIRGLS